MKKILSLFSKRICAEHDGSPDALKMIELFNQLKGEGYFKGYKSWFYGLKRFKGESADNVKFGKQISIKEMNLILTKKINDLGRKNRND